LKKNFNVLLVMTIALIFNLQAENISQRHFDGKNRILRHWRLYERGAFATDPGKRLEEKDGTICAGNTDWKVNWDLKYFPNGDESCSLNAYQVFVEAVYTLPRLTGIEKVPPDLQRIGRRQRGSRNTTKKDIKIWR